MNRLLTITAIALLSGCSMLEAPIESSDVVQGRRRSMPLKGINPKTEALVLLTPFVEEPIP